MPNRCSWKQAFFPSVHLETQLLRTIFSLVMCQSVVAILSSVSEVSLIVSKQIQYLSADYCNSAIQLQIFIPQTVSGLYFTLWKDHKYKDICLTVRKIILIRQKFIWYVNMCASFTSIFRWFDNNGIASHAWISFAIYHKNGIKCNEVLQNNILKHNQLKEFNDWKI